MSFYAERYRDPRGATVVAGEMAPRARPRINRTLAQATDPSADDLPEVRLAKAAFEAEALPCLDAVYHFALRLRQGDPDEAADLAHETFLRAYRGWTTYRPGTKILSWLFTICRNAAIRQGEARGWQRERTLTELGVETAEGLSSLAHAAGLALGNPEGAYFDSFIDDEVLQAIDELPDEFREAVVLSDLHDLAYGEIAEILRIPGGTVKSRIHRGRRILQEKLRGYAEDMGYIRRA